ncbi:MAG: Small-conductance mechanosensitive channel [Saprospiraceae bacterium]|nr:Small-conductance mechanosensitive channel [Saprospiraceae bacterium]
MYAFLLSLATLAGSVFIGWLLERIALRRWLKDNYIFGALRGLGVFAGAWMGVHILLRYFQLPESWRNIILSLWQSVFILAITIYLARLTGRLINKKMSDGNGLLPTATLLQNVAKALIFMIGFMVLLQTQGISVAPMLTALGVGGLAVALALQGTLSNLFSGIQIIASRKIRIGHFIRLEEGLEGYVTDINWRSTTIRALSNQTIILPNAKLADSTITNTWVPDPEIAVAIPVGVSYDSDLEYVERVTLEVAGTIQASHPGAAPGFEPVVRFNEFADSSINFRVVLRAKEFSEQFLMRHDFIKALHTRYKKEGINIPFPIQTVQFDLATPLSVKDWKNNAAHP